MRYTSGVKDIQRGYTLIPRRTHLLLLTDLAHIPWHAIVLSNRDEQYLPGLVNQAGPIILTTINASLSLKCSALPASAAIGES